MGGTGVLERPIGCMNGVLAGVMVAVKPQRKGVAVTRSFGTSLRQFETLSRSVPFRFVAAEATR